MGFLDFFRKEKELRFPSSEKELSKQRRYTDPKGKIRKFVDYTAVMAKKADKEAHRQVWAEERRRKRAAKEYEKRQKQMQREEEQSQKQFQRSGERIQQQIRNQTQTSIIQQGTPSNSALDRAKRREAVWKSRQVRKEVGWVPKIFKFVLIILIILGFFVAYMFNWLPPTVKSSIDSGLDKLTDPELREMIAKGFSKLTFSQFQKSVSEISYWGNPDVVHVDKKKMGVFVENFEPDRFFWEQEKIILRGDLVPVNLESDFELTITCHMEKYYGTAITSVPEERKQGNEVTLLISKDDQTPKEFSCIFPEGVSIEEKEDVIDVDKAKKNKEILKKAFVNVVSDYTANTVLLFYTIGEEKLKEYGKKDPFGVSGKKKSLIKQGLWVEKYKQVLPQQQDYGPMELALGMKGQPYVKGGHLLSLNLREAEIFTLGSMKSLNSLSFRLPEYATVDKELCPDFVKKGNRKEWELKPEIIDIINNCDKNKDCGLDIADLAFFCGINVNVDKPYKELKASLITATAEYTYEADKFTTVRVKKGPGIVSLEGEET